MRNEEKKFCGVCSACGDKVLNFMALLVCVNVVYFIDGFFCCISHVTVALVVVKRKEQIEL